MPKEIVLESATTRVVLRASETSKGLEIDVQGANTQRVSIQRDGVELASVSAVGGLSVASVTDAAATATYAQQAKLASVGADAYLEVCEERLFTEAGAGTYTATVDIPAGATVLDVVAHNTANWAAATSASLIVGDADNDDGYIEATNVKAATAVSSLLGSVGAGAYKQFYKYYAAAGVISGVITSVGAGTTGRTRMMVRYVKPTAVAAVKS